MHSQPAITAVLTPRKFSTCDIPQALTKGWRTFRRLPGANVAFAGLCVLIGLLLLATVGYLDASPMALPVAGGFMLVGPILLTGFFRLAAILGEGRKPCLRDALSAVAQAPAGLWMIAGVCSFLFLPLLAVTLPILAYGSFAIYREVFPLPTTEPRHDTEER